MLNYGNPYVVSLDCIPSELLRSLKLCSIAKCSIDIQFFYPLVHYKEYLKPDETENKL